MKKAKISKNKLLIKILLMTLVFIILGILYISILSDGNKVLIEKNLSSFFNSINKLNYNQAFIKCFLSNTFYILSIWLLGISILGIPFILLILILKSFILGFSISSILYFYKFKGIIICIIYIIPLIINLLLMILLSYYSIQFSKNLNKLLFSKKDVNFQNVMKRYIKILLASLLVILASSLIEIYLIPNILKLLQI